MNGQSDQTNRALDDIARTAERLARRMGAEFTRDIKVMPVGEQNFGCRAEPLPMRTR